jgi:hypothetical protein
MKEQGLTRGTMANVMYLLIAIPSVVSDKPERTTPILTEWGMGTVFHEAFQLIGRCGGQQVRHRLKSQFRSRFRDKIAKLFVFTGIGGRI